MIAGAPCRPHAREWRFLRPDGSPWRVNLKGRLRVDNGDASRIAALSAFGRPPTFVVRADLKIETLASALERYLEQRLAVHAVTPHARRLSPAVRVLVDCLAERFGSRPSWDPAG